MNITLLKNTCRTTIVILILLFYLPTSTKAQSEEILEIADIAVTPDNCGDLSVIKGVSGKVQYNPQTKVLILENATINITDGHGIYSEVKGLIIKLVGTSNILAKKAAIGFREALTITGGGTLNVESVEDCAFYAIETDLTIDNCVVNAKSSLYGISGNSSSSEKLTIRHATVTAEGTKRGSIRDFAAFELIGCNITQPSGAVFNSTKHCVELNGTMVKEKVVITKDPTGLDMPNAEKVSRPKVYTLNGICVQGELENQPTGVYIVNGKKIVKK